MNRRHGVPVTDIQSVADMIVGKRKASAVCNTCSLQTKLELLLN